MTTTAAASARAPMRPWKREWVVCMSLLLVAGLIGLFTPPAESFVAGGPVNSGDVAWMLTATALVLLMTPGLSFFYGGMVHRKT